MGDDQITDDYLEMLKGEVLRFIQHKVKTKQLGPNPFFLSVLDLAKILLNFGLYTNYKRYGNLVTQRDEYHEDHHGKHERPMHHDVVVTHHVFPFLHH